MGSLNSACAPCDLDSFLFLPLPLFCFVIFPHTTDKRDLMDDIIGVLNTHDEEDAAYLQVYIIVLLSLFCINFKSL